MVSNRTDISGDVLIGFLVALALMQSPQCGDNVDTLWLHVYHAPRLVINTPCISFVGVIEKRRAEPDGDDHIQLRLDRVDKSPINAKNRARQNGCLVVEPICQHPVKQADAIEACRGVTPLAVPPTGTRVRVTGSLVLDNEGGHGWVEIHPVLRPFEVLGADGQWHDYVAPNH